MTATTTTTRTTATTTTHGENRDPFSLLCGHAGYVRHLETCAENKWAEVVAFPCPVTTLGRGGGGGGDLIR